MPILYSHKRSPSSPQSLFCAAFPITPIVLTFFKGRITSEYGVVTIKYINSDKYESCKLRFNMDVVFSDMMDN